MFKPCQPIKRKNGKAILGFFYRDHGSTIQYVTFRSSVASIAKDKVVPATMAEYLADRQKRYAKVAQMVKAANEATHNQP